MDRHISIFFIICLLSSSLLGISKIDVVKCENLNPIKFGVNFFSTHNHYEPPTPEFPYLSDKELNNDFSMFKEQELKTVTLCAVWKYHEQVMVFIMKLQ